MPPTVPAIDKALASNNFALAHILYWEWTQREQHEALANEYLKRICEGFGFIAIGRDENYNVLLAIPTGETETDENGQTFDQVTWQAYEDIVK